VALDRLTKDALIIGRSLVRIQEGPFSSATASIQLLPTTRAYPRENNFDLLRIILAYTVVIYHSGYLTGHDRLTPGSLAAVAVAGFFVISGFLLTWSSRAIRGSRRLP
jgi:hypothetical protein